MRLKNKKIFSMSMCLLLGNDATASAVVKALELASLLPQQAPENLEQRAREAFIAARKKLIEEAQESERLLREAEDKIRAGWDEMFEKDKPKPAPNKNIGKVGPKISPNTPPPPPPPAPGKKVSPPLNNQSWTERQLQDILDFTPEKFTQEQREYAKKQGWNLNIPEEKPKTPPIPKQQNKTPKGNAEGPSAKLKRLNRRFAILGSGLSFNEVNEYVKNATILNITGDIITDMKEWLALNANNTEDIYSNPEQYPLLVVPDPQPQAKKTPQVQQPAPQVTPKGKAPAKLHSNDDDTDEEESETPGVQQKTPTPKPAPKGKAPKMLSSEDEPW